MELFIKNSVFFLLPPMSSNFHPLQVENCDSNSRRVVDEDDNGKFRLVRVQVAWMKAVSQYFRVVAMLAYCRRRWTSIKTALV